MARVVSNNGLVTLAIPSNFLPSETDDTPEVFVVSVRLATPQGGKTNVNGAIPLVTLEIEITDDGTPEAGIPFAQPITVTMSYDPPQLVAAGLAEANLRIYILDQQGNVTELPSVVDPVNHTVMASVPHLTLLILGDARSKIYLPISLNNLNLPGW